MIPERIAAVAFILAVVSSVDAFITDAPAAFRHRAAIAPAFAYRSDADTLNGSDEASLPHAGSTDVLSTTGVNGSRVDNERSSLLNELLTTASASGRGEFATDEQKSRAAEVIDQLEVLSPTADPTKSAMIEGTWELLYSDTQLFRSSPFFMAGRAVCETEEQARQYDWFCDMHRAALAISNIGAVRQVVGPDRIVSEFEVKVGAVPFLSDLTPLRYSGGLPVTIDGAIVSSADIKPTGSSDAWEIFMDTVEIKGSNVPVLRQILDGGLKLGSRDLGSFLEENVAGYTNPKPVFTTTYLDESVRISRDQDGKVFVYGKVSSDTEPTDYSDVMPDLGVTKLLEGFNDAITKFYL